LKEDEKTKKLLGGAIDSKRVTFKDVEPTAPVTQGETTQERFHQVLQRIAKDETATTIHLSSMRDDLSDYRMRNIVPYYMYDYWYHRFPEKKLHDNAKKMFSGHGAHKDNHRAHKLFMDSFQHHPEILSAYTRGRVR
jgi:hypothetical protein